jgi:hypothetical protein
MFLVRLWCVGAPELTKYQTLFSGETKSETMRTILLFTISIGIESILSAQAAALNGLEESGKKRGKSGIRKLSGKSKISGRSS